MGRDRCGGETALQGLRLPGPLGCGEKDENIQPRHKHKEHHFELKRIPGCQCSSPVLMSPNLQFPGAGRIVGRSLHLHNVYIGVYLFSHVQYFKNTGGHRKLFPLYSLFLGGEQAWSIAGVPFTFAVLLEPLFCFLLHSFPKKKEAYFLIIKNVKTEEW